VWVDGKTRVSDKQLIDIDLEQIRNKATQWRTRITDNGE